MSTAGSHHRNAGAAAPGPNDAEEHSRAVREAIRAVRAGDVQAFGAIVDLFERRIFALALMLTRNPTAAEETAQDAFVRAFTHLDAYDDSRPIYPWLATIAVRLAQNWQVRRAREVSREDAGASIDELAGASEDQLEALIADEEGRRLWRSVAALPWGERTAAILHYRQGLSVTDVAAALGVTAGTVKTLLFRARRRLRRGTADEDPGGGAE